jgi:hypothetical protein
MTVRSFAISQASEQNVFKKSHMILIARAVPIANSFDGYRFSDRKPRFVRSSYNHG